MKSPEVVIQMLRIIVSEALSSTCLSNPLVLEVVQELVLHFGNCAAFLVDIFDPVIDTP